jgi:hypothetical protein
MANLPDLELNFVNNFDARTFEAIAEDMGAGGAHVELTPRPPDGPYAFLEWLIPTALILWMVKPYLQTFSKETGKLHAQGLHSGLSKLWGKVFGPKPEVTYHIVGSKGKVKPEVFSAAVSVRAKRNDGGDVILLFRLGISNEDFSLAVYGFMELMKQHYSLNGPDGLTKTMLLVSYLDHPNFQALVYMNPETKELELIDYVVSSQTGTLTTHRIPK